MKLTRDSPKSTGDCQTTGDPHDGVQVQRQLSLTLAWDSRESIGVLALFHWTHGRRQGLSLAKTSSTFGMNDIRGGRGTSYMNDIQP